MTLRAKVLFTAISLVVTGTVACDEDPRQLEPPEKERDNRPGLVETPREEAN